MAFITTSDGVRLHVEDFRHGTAGATPIVFVHELGGSCRSYDHQVAAFRDRYRCVIFNARGFPPSEVPADVGAYSQDTHAADIVAVLDGLSISQAHLVGVSMGAASVLQVALNHPSRVRSATLASIGSGSDEEPRAYHAGIEARAAEVEARGMAHMAHSIAAGPNRRKLKEKWPEEHGRFIEQFSALSPLGFANTLRGVQKGRPPVYTWRERAVALRLPVLVIVGEDDAACRKPCDFLARAIPGAQFEMFAGTGHMVNLEEVELFNRTLAAFLERVENTRGEPA